MRTRIKQGLSLLIVLTMAISLLGGNAWAVETDKKESLKQKEEQAVELSSGAMSVETSGACGENLTWKLEDGTLTISGSGAMTEWEYYSDVPWNNSRSDITTVIIGKGVSSIGGFAFYECESVTSVTIPNSVMGIGENAFAFCGNLLHVTIPDGVISIGEDAFSNCSSLEDVTMGKGVTHVGISAFDLCKGLQNIYISDLSAWCKIDFEDYYANPLYYADNLYLNDTLVEELTIPNDVVSIGDNAFSCYGSLTSVIITDNVKSIGNYSFAGCSNLASVVIPDSVTNIGECAFYGCSSLISVKIPNSVTSIGIKAFQNCSKLASVTISDSVTNVSQSMFYRCGSLTSVTIGTGVTSIGNNAFFGCSSLTSVKLPDNLTSIGISAFAECSGLAGVKIPDAVTTIGNAAFENCGSLTSVSIPDSVTSIGWMAFSKCSKLTDVYYAGSESDWKKISINDEDNGNQNLKDANIHYNSTGQATKSISTCTIELEETSYPYDGKEKKPTVTVKDGSTTLTSGRDYKVTYADNTDVGTAKVTIDGKGNYTGTVSKTFQIKAAGLSEAIVTLVQTNVTYTGTAQTPAVTVTLNGKTLSTADYTVAYQNHTNAGTAKVTVTGQGNYTGTATATFTIAKAGNTVTASSVNKTASAKAYSFSIGAKAKGGAKLTYKSNNKSITVDKNGKVTIAKNCIGKATITISASATTNYNATIKKITVTVNPSSTKLSSLKSAKAGQLTVKWGKNTVVTGYEVQYGTTSNFSGAKILKVKNNKTVTNTLSKLKEGRKYYVRIRTYKTVGKANYYSAWSAAKSATVKGVTAPAAVKLTSVKSAKTGEMTVKWGKNAKAGGYQLQYATAKNFKGTKTVTIKKAATTSTTIKKLTKGKKYYVRVRTYQKVGGKTYYSTWSASKNVTIKK